MDGAGAVRRGGGRRADEAADHQAHQLRGAAGGQDPVQQARAVLLQLQQLRDDAAGQPLPARLLRHHPLRPQHELN